MTVVIGAMLLIKVADVGYHHYKALFLQGAALKVGHPITIAGIPVGEVTSMELAGDHVEAGLRSATAYLWVRNPARPSKSPPFSDPVTCRCQPAGEGSVPDNTFDLEHTEVPYDLQEALSDVTTTYEQVDSTSSPKRSVFSVINCKPCPRSFRKHSPTPRRSRRIIVSDATSWARLKTTETVTDTLRRQQSTIGSLVRQGE